MNSKKQTQEPEILNMKSEIKLVTKQPKSEGLK